MATKWRHLTVAAVAALAVSGCGSGSEPGAADPEPERPGEAAPDCAALWVDGGTLPEEYDGCVADGVLVEADGFPCEFGIPLFTYADRYYAVAGGRINETDGPLANSEQYLNAFDSCAG
ncbi:hypothetical protein [Nocardioides limicola]|uniref:hypothetical protein n=1 Tax=Nocardioides limicola TaxID=2803368 RepID=UPI00193B05F5|nr:hypothetical protein [Nocardioides sp. DJM-14]